VGPGAGGIQGRGLRTPVSSRRAPVGTHWSLLAAVAISIVVVDQLTKWWAVENLADGPIDMVGSLRLKLVYNYASAFSIGGGGVWGPLVSIIAVLVVAGLMWMARSGTTRLGATAIGLVAGGAVGNLIDRAARSDSGFMGGGVVDFVDVQWWPVFNVADAAIVVGVLMLVVVSLLGRPPVAMVSDASADPSVGDTSESGHA